MTTDLLDLTSRAGLPDALRVLAKEFPREAWQAHANYSQLIDFWLNRHMMFRKLLTQLNTDAEAAVDRKLEAQAYKARVHRFGGMLINELHGHHQIEDAHYFPVMSGLDARVASGFDILDSDHHLMDETLHALATGANALLQAEGAGFHDKTGAFHHQLDAFGALLNRHLLDEEELVVPVLLKYAPEQFR
ncbi:MAG: hemerythrin domain-containing protein [Aestuariivita sp.]|uniref:hemerythrin domain-containing protein n=1 Tax=Aestuariivita sp. TaxID=1872407 RepID=UPI003BAF495C